MKPADTKPSERQRAVWRLRAKLRALYHGESPGAVRFRLGVIGVDLVLIAFFIAAPFLRDSRAFLPLDLAVAAILAADMAARALAWRSLKSWIRRPIVMVDLFVLLTLLFPTVLINLAFLRVLRIWTLFHSDFFWETVGHRFDDTRWEDVIRAAATLVTFVFVATGFVYTIYVGDEGGVSGYIDALYFTVTSLTTTGYGDIILPGITGRLVSIVIMISGITLFVRFAQALFRPYKVRFTCQVCGLMRHEPDAVHCKACGALINIPNED
ncbi:potassium channel family protein [Phenylobacterium sp.]|uniref:potassium channel family protein n=1 Tax=Phenylobacterium sp. TaxID=1871053 RepID=UPI002730DB64|nr:potassium channel family protein [Phenylobacterium sp.]MDP1874262.1 potassium channel family protein [Phenylobacterium sp.]MDP3299315.1 potassium channel family protein [Phenylobacterium sp.]MDP3490374.1 potassium channel family protein [Phenylobacterium sp.]